MAADRTYTLQLQDETGSFVSQYVRIPVAPLEGEDLEEMLVWLNGAIAKNERRRPSTPSPEEKP